jgi:putative Mg2+ transporter-C (MgtC) family protein
VRNSSARAWPFAAVLTGLVVFTNLGLRPLVKFLKRHTRAGDKVLRSFRVMLTCRAEEEGQTRALLLRTLAVGGLHLSEIAAVPSQDGAMVDLSVIGTGEGLSDEVLELAFSRIAVEPGLGRFRWEMLDES